MPHLVLFDIDGTLMVTGGAGRRAILRAGKEVFGAGFEWGPITVGRLDPEIYRELCEHNRIGDPDAHHEAYYGAYLAAIGDELRHHAGDIKVMPGVRALLAELEADPRTTPGLLSGNYREAAMLKLRAAGIDPARLPVTAFAEDGRQRRDLVAAAMTRYQRLHGRGIEPGRVIIVGDTPRDIECARAHGCGALAVATGRYTTGQLSQAGADRVVADLSDADPLRHLLQSD